jgi:hypothetical protein
MAYFVEVIRITEALHTAQSRGEDMRRVGIAVRSAASGQRNATNLSRSRKMPVSSAGLNSGTGMRKLRGASPLFPHTVIPDKRRDPESRFGCNGIGSHKKPGFHLALAPLAWME